MTTSFLRLPVDIPWERICVTEDMIDRKICDPDFPPKWYSSIAVFKYRPEEDYQIYPNNDVIYLKVAVTLSGYQPRDKEIEGQINWSGLSEETLNDVESLLSEYHPCTGALIQVSVAPTDRAISDPKMYPYFLDFEPKKRELYEVATDTKEKVTRSLSSLNIGKSSGAIQSQEVLDIDAGGGGGGQLMIFGTGGGFNAQSNGQWGTKDVGTNQSGLQRTTDEATERRETLSFTTQLSQLYHLLDSYHLGTNRIVFFVQPRPHTLEEPTGFVAGPRPVEGIQEFFLVVLKPKDQDDICVSVRVDTAHLAQIDILEHDYKRDSISLGVSASPPERNDAKAVFDGYDNMKVDYFVDEGTRRYKCYAKTEEQVDNYISPWPEYKIDVADNGGYVITAQSASYGSYSVDAMPDGSSLTAKVLATARKCFNDGGDFCVDCPDTWHARSANSSLSLVINLVSKEPTVKVGTDQILLVTTRGLCCCAHGPQLFRPGVVSIDSVPSLVGRYGSRFGLTDSVIKTFTGGRPHKRGMALMDRRQSESSDKDEQPADQMSARVANALGNIIRTQMIARTASGNPETAEPTPFIYSDYFLNRLERSARPSHHVAPRESGVGSLLKSSGADRRGLEEYFGQKIDKLSSSEIARSPTAALAQAAGINTREAARLRLAATGVSLKKERQ